MALARRRRWAEGAGSQDGACSEEMNTSITHKLSFFSYSFCPFFRPSCFLCSSTPCLLFCRPNPNFTTLSLSRGWYDWMCESHTKCTVGIPRRKKLSPLSTFKKNKSFSAFTSQKNHSQSFLFSALSQLHARLIIYTRVTKVSQG